ncbi:MAG: universal stress protein, partial [Gemmatimonadaceae bacterium]|nr:universal stress protein [Gloeobacterales cyanobacterium ES-bin-141]
MHRQADGRPDPQQLLRDLIQLSHGRHKIYLGFAPGAGKTYRMLKEAQALKCKGVDLVVGVVETHGRPETEELLSGLEVIAPRQVAYQGTVLSEMDVDAILARRPATVLVDELAHTNAPGSSRQKRYEDIEALLTAGISVISTVNIQHLDSVAETAGRFIGAPIHERVPDRILRAADEVQLVDASPETILDRLDKGKVDTHGLPTAGQFFRKSTLVFLRELALRTAAEKVDAALLTRPGGVAGPAGVRERILVAVSTNPASKRLIRRGARTAQLLDAEFTVVYVQTGAQLNQAQLDTLDTYQKMTEQVEGTFVTLEGRDVAQILTEFAVARSITKVIVGESLRSPWEELVRGSVVNKLLRATHNLDVLIVGERESASPGRPAPAVPTIIPSCLVRTGDERRHRGCGRHKIYLGAAPGVGKTYAMLTEAHDMKAQGTDIVCGVIETHGRAETAALIEGLEVVPKKQVVYQGRVFEELDLEAILTRRPAIALIDELAHTNVPGCGSAAKRYQDVETLLSNGIDVISTMNIQHLESLNTIIERTTGVKVRETVPDLVLECADEAMLIDLPAAELQERMREGKIYAPAKIEQALTNFFRQENITALRELLLREVADDCTTRTLDETLPELRHVATDESECLLVCINLRPNAQQLIRRGTRIAKRLAARFLVAYVSLVDTKPAESDLHELERLRHLCEELGGTYLERQAVNVAEAIVLLAQEEGV